MTTPRSFNWEASSISTVSTTGLEPLAYSKTSFVFTSSRTLRALRVQEERNQTLSPTSVLTSPPAAVAPSSKCLPSDAKAPGSLTLSQLLMHSDGAITARSLLTRDMIASGFIQLKPRGLCSELSCASAPEISSARRSGSSSSFAGSSSLSSPSLLSSPCARSSAGSSSQPPPTTRPGCPSTHSCDSAPVMASPPPSFATAPRPGMKGKRGRSSADPSSLVWMSRADLFEPPEPAIRALWVSDTSVDPSRAQSRTRRTAPCSPPARAAKTTSEAGGAVHVRTTLEQRPSDQQPDETLIRAGHPSRLLASGHPASDRRESRSGVGDGATNGIGAATGDRDSKGKARERAEADEDDSDALELLAALALVYDDGDCDHFYAHRRNDMQTQWASAASSLPNRDGDDPFMATPSAPSSSKSALVRPDVW
ncbi:hypothetical protein C8Q76DRAFT_793465 [Earliella scabrosa]|nr:hypothetical protein C8Q76DRAFT_793465 [Earliella scabrosa]